MPAVLVPVRPMQQEILDSEDLQAAQLRGAFRPHSRQGGYWPGQW